MLLKWSLYGHFGAYVRRKASICKMLIAIIEIQQNNFKNYKILDYNTFSSDIPIMFANTHQLHKFSVWVMVISIKMVRAKHGGPDPYIQGSKISNC